MDKLLRYQRNLGILTPDEQSRLLKSRVCVVGCGGLGGFLIEYLGRMGVGHITAVDGDGFDITNLNRQILSTEKVLGKSKALQAKERMAQVNSQVHVEAVEQFLTAENAQTILAGHDLVLDALDNIPRRLMLQRFCAQLGIPMIHGAVESWYGQVATVFPGDNTLLRIYPGHTESEAPGTIAGTPAFSPALVAALQAGEAVKLLAGREPGLRGKVLFADLLANQFDLLDI